MRLTEESNYSYSNAVKELKWIRLLLYAYSRRIIHNKNEKSEDYSKADLKQRVLLFKTIFRLAIPAFFRFTNATDHELM